MFTGLVEEIGVVREIGSNDLAIEAHKVLEGTKVGDSIAVNGVCLTVTSLSSQGFSADVMPETLRRSNLGKLHYGDRVNMERALTAGGRIGGHLVLGHVDDTGEVVAVTVEEAARVMKILAPAKLMPYIVDKGFIAIDGVSLTVTSLDSLFFTVSLVSHTLGHTTLGNKKPGDIVNLEADIIAKYLERLNERRKQGLTLDFLKEYGFVEEKPK
jgi:riboflavin synthase